MGCQNLLEPLSLLHMSSPSSVVLLLSTGSIFVHCRIVKAGPSKSNYTVDYTLIYIANTNGFLKKAIERGVLQYTQHVNLDPAWHRLCGKPVPHSQELATASAKTLRS